MTGSACSVCQPPVLTSLIQAEPALAAAWMALPRRRFGAGERLQLAGQASTRCWQLTRGVVRCYYLNDEGTERNRAFHGPGQWVAGSLPPVTMTSPFTIEALAPVEAVELAHETLQHWQRTWPQLGALMEEALGYVFQQNARREADLLSQPPEVRYQSFLASHSDLVAQLPQHHVASYLGITPVSLSRIRARLGLLDPTRPR